MLFWITHQILLDIIFIQKPFKKCYRETWTDNTFETFLISLNTCCFFLFVIGSALRNTTTATMFDLIDDLSPEVWEDKGSPPDDLSAIRK